MEENEYLQFQSSLTKLRVFYLKKYNEDGLTIHARDDITRNLRAIDRLRAHTDIIIYKEKNESEKKNKIGFGN